MMPMLMRRKARKMEKVENLYRTATVEKIFANTPEQIRSRLRELLGAGDVEPARSSTARRKVKT